MSEMLTSLFIILAALFITYYIFTLFKNQKPGKNTIKSYKILLKVFNIWMIFVIFSKISLLLPHWNIPIIALLNYDLYFLIFLLSFIVFLENNHNKFIFLNLSIFSLLYAISIVTIFIGEDYLFGNNTLQYLIWTYRKILISIIMNITILFIVIDYIYHNKHTIFKYTISLLIVIPLSFFINKTILLDYRFIFVNQENHYFLFKNLLIMDLCAISFFIMYGIINYKNNNKPISKHVSLITTSFLVFTVVDTIDNFFNYFHLTVPVLSHIFLILNLVFFIIILIDNIFYLNSEFGKFYENIKFSKINLNIRIIRKKTYIEKYIFLIQQHFLNIPNRFLFITLIMVSLILFTYLYPFGYVLICGIVLTLLMIIIFIYLNLLIKKRSKNKLKQLNNN